VTIPNKTYETYHCTLWAELEHRFKKNYYPNTRTWFWSCFKKLKQISTLSDTVNKRGRQRDILCLLTF